jgi:endo-beta-N-acetylglucosaminidase D
VSSGILKNIKVFKENLKVEERVGIYITKKKKKGMSLIFCTRLSVDFEVFEV